MRIWLAILTMAALATLAGCVHGRADASNGGARAELGRAF